MKTPKTDPSRAALYLEKARRFSASAESAFEKGLWDPAASAAIHSGINAVDAATVRCLGLRAAGAGHHEALDLLETIRGLPRKEVDRLVHHLGILLGMKTLAEYSDRLLKQDQARRCLVAMRRALAIVEGWAETW